MGLPRLRCHFTKAKALPLGERGRLRREILKALIRAVTDNRMKVEKWITDHAEATEVLLHPEDCGWLRVHWVARASRGIVDIDVSCEELAAIT